MPSQKTTITDQLPLFWSEWSANLLAQTANFYFLPGCGVFISHLLLNSPKLPTVSDMQHSCGARPRLPNAAVCCSVWLHPGVPEDDWWPGDTWSSSGALWGHGAPAAPEEAAAAAAAELKYWSDDAPHWCWRTVDEPAVRRTVQDALNAARLQLGSCCCYCSGPKWHPPQCYKEASFCLPSLFLVSNEDKRLRIGQQINVYSHLR